MSLQKGRDPADLGVFGDGVQNVNSFHRVLPFSLRASERLVNKPLTVLYYAMIIIILFHEDNKFGTDVNLTYTAANS